MILCLALTLFAGDSRAHFQIKDGDRVVLVGDALFEREARWGYLETALQSLQPDAAFSVRNLAWSGDSPSGASRAYFDPPDKGRANLIDHVRNADPTVLVVGYGMSACLDGRFSASTFQKEMTQFLEDVSSGVRAVILVSPISCEDLGPPYPAMDQVRRNIDEVSETLRTLADRRSALFVDARDHSISSKDRPLTTNGIHLSDAGYRAFADRMIESLFGDVPPPSATVAFSTNPVALTLSRWPIASRNESPTVRVTGLRPGEYRLLSAGEELAKASASEWERGVAIRSNAPWRQAQAQLRQEVRAKDQFYFERYRPPNITYLLGFRAHEQGQNAKDLDALDRFAKEKDRKIATLKRPTALHCRLEETRP